MLWNPVNKFLFKTTVALFFKPSSGLIAQNNRSRKFLNHAMC